MQNFTSSNIFIYSLAYNRYIKIDIYSPNIINILVLSIMIIFTNIINTFIKKLLAIKVVFV